MDGTKNGQNEPPEKQFEHFLALAPEIVKNESQEEQFEHLLALALEVAKMSPQRRNSNTF